MSAPKIIASILLVLAGLFASIFLYFLSAAGGEAIGLQEPIPMALVLIGAAVLGGFAIGLLWSMPARRSLVDQVFRLHDGNEAIRKELAFALSELEKARAIETGARDASKRMRETADAYLDELQRTRGKLLETLDAVQGFTRRKTETGYIRMCKVVGVNP